MVAGGQREAMQTEQGGGRVLNLVGNGVISSDQGALARATVDDEAKSGLEQRLGVGYRQGDFEATPLNFLNRAAVSERHRVAQPRTDCVGMRRLGGRERRKSVGV